MAGADMKERELANRVGKARRRRPALDEALRRYRESRREYDSKRVRKDKSQGYRPQRGIRRDYRV